LPKEAEIPDGFAEHRNEELGFRFVYPKEWGNLKVSEYALDHVFDIRYVGTLIYNEGGYWEQSEDSAGQWTKGTKADPVIDYKDATKTVWSFGWADGGYGQSLPTFIWKDKIVQITTPPTCSIDDNCGDADSALIQYTPKFDEQYDTLVESISALN
jgi:hypothetical protein